jgi:hypothetical protein
VEEIAIKTGKILNGLPNIEYRNSMDCTPGAFTTLYASNYITIFLMPRSFDVPRGCTYNWLRCLHCLDDQEARKAPVLSADQGNNIFNQNHSIPHTFEALEKHIEDVHPVMLESFHKGWENLTPNAKEMWTFNGRRLPIHSVYSEDWLSWSHVQSQLYTNTSCDLQGLQTIISDVIRQKMPHTGIFYNIPSVPGEMAAKNAHYSNGGPLSINLRFEETFFRIADQAATAILNVELPKLVQKIKTAIEEDGLDVVREWYPRGP